MLNKHKIIFLICLGIVGVVIVLTVRQIVDQTAQKIPVKVYQQKALTIRDTTVSASVANTDALRELGLSDRKSLAANAGMLFVFEAPDRYSFWMKDMYFPLDLLWISADHIVVDITENATPESFPATFSPKAPAQFVLEVNAGFVAQHHLVVGDFVGGL